MLYKCRFGWCPQSDKMNRTNSQRNRSWEKSGHRQAWGPLFKWRPLLHQSETSTASCNKIWALPLNRHMLSARTGLKRFSFARLLVFFTLIEDLLNVSDEWVCYLSTISRLFPMILRRIYLCFRLSFPWNYVYVGHNITGTRCMPI